MSCPWVDNFFLQGSSLGLWKHFRNSPTFGRGSKTGTAGSRNILSDTYDMVKFFTRSLGGSKILFCHRWNSTVYHKILSLLTYGGVSFPTVTPFLFFLLHTHLVCRPERHPDPVTVLNYYQTK